MFSSTVAAGDSRQWTARPCTALASRLQGGDTQIRQDPSEDRLARFRRRSTTTYAVWMKKILLLLALIGLITFAAKKVKSS